MKKTKTITYLVVCPNNPEHEFPKTFEIIEGTENSVESEVEAFCPFCSEKLVVTIQGKLKPDTELMRKFGLKPD